MFLQNLITKNEKLITTAHKLHKDGIVLPDSYIIDLDTLFENAQKILREAQKHNLHLYYMTKQIGRNPYIAKKLETMGFDGFVAVDYKDARIMMKHNLKAGHIGHLVQIPEAKIKEIVAYKPEIITAYSLEKAKAISDAAAASGRIQDIMLRIIGPSSHIYEGQKAGTVPEELYEFIQTLQNYKGVRLCGLTSFPCFLYDNQTKKITATKNIEEMHRAKELIERNFNIKILHMNMPSVTSIENLHMIKAAGGTHGEPGHALTGTTPFNLHADSVEKPAYIYVSEISHVFKNKSYFFGGGYYARGHLEQVLIEDGTGQLQKKEVSSFSPGNIDYYLEVNSKQSIGKTVLGCFRTQMFVTRSDIVLTEGIQSGNPVITGIYTPEGIKKDF
ncbi:alanine racemase [Treponema sp. HNW]|uniref:alanine racemase n=1 Tax=Treponema sp. HNW TaxID=3116654 RepID=UPI003D0DD7F3